MAMAREIDQKSQPEERLDKPAGFYLRPDFLGALLAANYALYGAKANPKIRAIAMLDPVIWAWGEASDHETLGSIDQPVLLVTGDGMGDLTKKFAATVAENDLNKVLRYPGSIVAYLRFREDKELEPTIVRWFKERLVGNTKQ
jgi:hypothetical protein